MALEASSDERATLASEEWLLLFVLVIGQLTVSADFTLASFALPAIGTAFHADPLSLSWVISAMMLCFAGVLLLGGSLSDLLGQKRCMMLGLAIGAIAAVLSAAASSMAMLIASRALQGIGDALTYPAILSLLFATFDGGARRFAALSISTAAQSLSFPLSVIVAGQIFAATGWRGTFLVTFGLAVLALCLVPFTVRHPVLARTGDKSFDVVGALMSIVGCGLLVWALPSLVLHGLAAGAWVLGALVGGLLVLGAFVFTQSRKRAPLVPREVFRSRNFLPGFFLMFTITIPIGGLLCIGLVGLQQGLAFTPQQAGFALLPYGVASLIVSMIAPHLAGTIFRHSRATLAAAFLAMGASLAAVSLAPVSAASLYFLLAAVLLVPVASSIAYNLIMSEALQNVVDARRGAAAGMVYAGIQLAMAIGVPILLAAVDPLKLRGPWLPSLAAFSTSFQMCAVVCLAGVMLSFTISRPAA
ncbi:MAG: transporter [Bradyrhizobium sp.]|nr:transporter [Bradyrhizobium sp.]